MNSNQPQHTLNHFDQCDAASSELVCCYCCLSMVELLTLLMLLVMMLRLWLWLWLWSWCGCGCCCCCCLLLLVVAIFNITTYPIPQLSSLPPCLFSILIPIDIHKNQLSLLDGLLESTSFLWLLENHHQHHPHSLHCQNNNPRERKNTNTSLPHKQNKITEPSMISMQLRPAIHFHTTTTYIPTKPREWKMPASLYLSPLETAIRHGKIQWPNPKSSSNPWRCRDL